ncbi:MAG: OmpA family protein [bacterium]|nr:OmpA family protein [bacterium]
MVRRTLAILALISIAIFIFGCASVHVAKIKNSLQKAPTGKCPWEKCADIRADWNRIAGMTDAEICKVLKCPEKVEIKEVIKEVPVEKIVEKEVIKEVPVEKIVYKEVPKETRKVLFVLPSVFFDTDKSELKPLGKKELDKAAKILAENGYPAIIISGHTDSRASDAYNQKLSEARANAVKKYLEEKGVPAGTMQAVGFGETRPVASNATKEGMAQNRRVEIELANP